MRPLSFAALIAMGVLFPSAAGIAQPKPGARIVFVGDSITDGNTYPQLVRQALADAGQLVPTCINAAIAGDTAHGMRKRLDRDVLVHKPSLVTLSAGINDVLHKVKRADYEADVTAIAERLKQAKVPLLILTTTVLGPRHADADRRLAEFNAVLRRVAAKYGARLAEVNKVLQSAREAKTEVLEGDQVHPNYVGQKLIARAVLDALGHKEIALPKELKLAPMPGLVKEWQIRVRKDKEPLLDEKTVLAVRPDATWKILTLPQKDAQPTWWLDHERRRGFALSLENLAGPGNTYLGVSTLGADAPQKVYLNTGAQLDAVWLNGKRVFCSDGWTGWHAGKERIPVELRAGRNVLVIETGAAFFLSITAASDW